MKPNQYWSMLWKSLQMAFRRGQTGKWEVCREIGTYLVSEVAEEPMNAGCWQGCEKMMRCGGFFMVSFWLSPFRYEVNLSILLHHGVLSNSLALL